MSNAFKFTLQGGITVTLRRLGNAVALTVRDTGCGIPAEELPRIFDRFHRVASASGRTHEGTGIGLALVSELVRRHGGTVEVRNNLCAVCGVCVCVSGCVCSMCVYVCVENVSSKLRHRLLARSTRARSLWFSYRSVAATSHRSK